MSSKSFVTNVGLITTKGKYGDNIMACEYTHQILGNPLQILVCLTSNEATYEHLESSREFGVSICAANQNIVSSIAGNNTGKEVDKIGVLKELGVEFYQASTIDTLMVEGAVLNAECKLIESIIVNSHNRLFIGEANIFTEHSKEPIIYHGGEYFNLGDKIQKPDQERLAQIDEIIKKYTS